MTEPNLKILIDESIPYAKTLFGRFGSVQTIEGRAISSLTLEQADALVVSSMTRVDAALLEGSQVKFVGTTTAGTDHIDKDWLTRTKISFSAASGCNAIAVVEYVFSALFWLAQRDGFSLRDKTIGIIGVGNIGSLLQERLKTFNINTMLCDPPLAKAGVIGDWKPLETLVAEADILTFHTPLTRDGQYATWHQVDEDLLSALPSGRIIINTCRGAVVDNAALLQALDGGKLLSVVLDVWEQEPELSLPLLARVDIGTAHIAGYTLESKARSVTKIFNAYSAFLGSDERVSLLTLLSPLPVQYIRLYGKIDEKALYMLANHIYNIKQDDIQLRRVASELPWAFDHLRKNYYQRREWSSLCIETDDSTSECILWQLGFQARPL